MVKGEQARRFSFFEVRQAFYAATLAAGVDRNKAYRWFEGETPEFVGNVIDAYYKGNPDIDELARQFGRTPIDIVRIIEIGTRQLWHSSPVTIRSKYPLKTFKVDVFSKLNRRVF